VGQFRTIGRYDGALFVSADNEEQVLRWLAELIAAGSVQNSSKSDPQSRRKTFVRSVFQTARKFPLPPFLREFQE